MLFRSAGAAPSPTAPYVAPNTTPGNAPAAGAAPAFGTGAPAGAPATPPAPVNGYPAVMPRVIPGSSGTPAKYTPDNMPPTLKPGGAFNPATPGAPAGTPTTPSEPAQPDKETVGALALPCALV